MKPIPSLHRGNFRFIEGLVPVAIPSILLALLPKCPACFAGYVALWTGVGVSLTVASGIRHSLIVVGAGMLLFLAGRALRRYRAQRHTEVPI